VCISKTLVCALAARAGLAVRQSLKVDKSGALATVVDQVGALIQAQDKSGINSKAIDTIRMLAGNTPDAIANLNEALTQVIHDITTNVDSMIIAGFNATQAAIDNSVSDLEGTTTTAGGLKGAANTADETWLSCITAEKGLNEDIETAQTEETAAIQGKVEPCNSQTESKLFESDPIESDPKWDFICDFTLGNCDSNMLDYEGVVNGMLGSLSAAAEEASGIWNGHKGRCDTAEQRRSDAVLALEKAKEDWSKKREICQSGHEARTAGMCSFGSAYQIKCSKVDFYTDLIGQVDEVEGSMHSEADRQQEWETTQVTKCLLQRVIDNEELNDQSTEDCKLGLDAEYLETVGTIDKKNDEFSAATSVDNFNCEESTITFKGTTWAVPEGLSTASADYILSDYSPAVARDVNESPFAFCSGEE